MQKLLIILSLLVSSSAYAGQTINQLPTPIPVKSGGTGLTSVGTNGLCLLSNGTGLEYGSCGGTAGAGGTDRQMQFNDSSVLSGTALLTVGTNALSQGLTTFTAKPTFVGVGTTTASINIPVGTQAPSSPVSGDVWVTDGLYVRVGTTTQGPLSAAILATPAADHTADGQKASVTVDTNAQGLYSCLLLASDGHYDEAKADAAATTACSALALETGTGTKTVLFSGFARDDSWSWTIGGKLYLSAATAGAITQTAPSTSTNLVQVIGIARSATVIEFTPNPIRTVEVP